MDIEKEINEIKGRLTNLEDWRANISDKSRLVSKLGLSRRALNVLQRANCDTIDDIIAYGPEKLRTVYNCGEKTYLEIKKAIM